MRTLYKFVGCLEAVRSIAGGSLKFTTIDELNDPSELAPHLNRDAVRESLAALRRDGHTEKQFEWLGCQEAMLRLLSPETRILSRPATIEMANRTLAMPIYDDLEFMERQLRRTIELIRQRVGVLSLTERFDSLPMWAHYAARAKGCVIRFEGLEREFCGDATGSLNALKPVAYVDHLVGMTFDPSTQDDIFYRKFQDWGYEFEWRVVSALRACQPSVEKTNYLRSVSRTAVTGVICGWNVSAEDIRPLAIELHQTNPALEVLAASLDRGKVVLKAIST